MADRAGQQFGLYQLTSLLTESPTAEVYRGEQRYSHINVAIKLLRRPLTTTAEIDAFRGEARTLAGLGHPHIVRILSFDVQDQTGFLVMDYAPGGTLRQRHPSGEAVPLEIILPYVKQAVEALQYAHDQGVVHQALKPEKLLLGHQDAIVLAGFYLASAYPPADAQTPEETRTVTAYLAPEQLQGRASPASDQYALGVMVYEWLSGAPPFQGSGAELAQHILKTAPPPLYGGAPTRWAAGERVLMRALAKDPAKRFASVSAFAAALEEAAQAEPVPQAAAASTAAAPASKQSAAAHPAAAQPARGSAPQPTAAHPPAGQAHARASAPASYPQPAPQQNWSRQPAPYQAPAQPPVWQRPSAPARSSSAGTVGCIIAIIVVILVAFFAILANTH
jgi:serine/threonine protein kinase